MKKEIKLIALDLDGTTFNSEKVITERTREAIAEAIKKGVIVMHPCHWTAKDRFAGEFYFDSGGALCVDFQWRSGC